MLGCFAVNRCPMEPAILFSVSFWLHPLRGHRSRAPRLSAGQWTHHTWLSPACLYCLHCRYRSLDKLREYLCATYKQS